MRIKDVEKLVSVVLASTPAARGSDKWLLVSYWNALGLDLTPDQIAKFMSFSTPETITRARRKIHSEGRWLPEEQIAKERQDKADHIRNEMVNWEVG